MVNTSEKILNNITSGEEEIKKKLPVPALAQTQEEA